MKGMCVLSIIFVTCSFLVSASDNVTNTPREKTDVHAVMEITFPKAMRGKFLTPLGLFSLLPAVQEETNSSTKTFFTFMPPEDERGCIAWRAPAFAQQVLALIKRGNCTFVHKAAMAQAAGVAGIIVINDDDDSFFMGGAAQNASEAELLQEKDLNIIAIMVKQSIGEQIVSWNAAHIDSVSVTVQRYIPPQPCIFCTAELIGATALVAAGAFFATSDLTPGSAFAPKEDEVLEIDKETASSFVFVGSFTLVTLFFVMKYAIYFLMFIFAFGGASAFVQLGSVMLSYLFSILRRRVFNVTLASIFATVPALGLALCWLRFRNDPIGWVFQDILGAGLICMLQRTMRLPNLKVATILLSSTFFFDIFWVFLSPLLFKKSVMVEVATGAGTGESVPMLFRIPIDDGLTHRENLLGFGDVALPGLLISYLLRYDRLRRLRLVCGYFVPGLLGYAVGLFATMVALNIMHMGQPALLYLVPSTLGTTCVLGWFRGELNDLWQGVENAPEAYSNLDRTKNQIQQSNKELIFTTCHRRGVPNADEIGLTAHSVPQAMIGRSQDVRTADDSDNDP